MSWKGEGEFSCDMPHKHICPLLREMRRVDKGKATVRSAELSYKMVDFLKAAVSRRPDYLAGAPLDGDVTGLSVKEIKAALRSRGVADAQLSACLDKQELVALLESTSPETASGSPSSANGVPVEAD